MSPAALQRLPSVAFESRPCGPPSAATEWRGRLLSHAASWLTALGALGLYVATLAPTITWAHFGADSGELITASYTLGVAHPTGYPTYLLLGKLFATLVPVGEVALRYNLLSAVLAAGTVLLLWWTVHDLLGELLGWADRLRGSAVAAASALAYAASPLFWSQSIIAEVHALQMLLVAGVIYLGVRQHLRGSARPRSLGSAVRIGAIGLLCGLGLGNHVSMAFLIPPLLFLGLARRWFTPRRSLAGVAGLCTGLVVYLYVPLRASTFPAIDWGGARDLSGFYWLVSAQIYRGYVLEMPVSQLASRIAFAADLLVRQFSWAGVVLGLAGVGLIWQRRRALAIFFVGYVLIGVLWAIVYNTFDSQLYLLPALYVFAVWIGIGGGLAWEAWGAPLAARVRRRAVAAAVRGLALAVLFLPAILALVLNLADVSLRGDREARDYAVAVFAAAGPRGIVIADSDRPLFSLWYEGNVSVPDTQIVVVAKPFLGEAWYRETLRHRHPQLAFADDEGGSPQRQFLLANLRAGRSLYLTSEDAGLTEALDVEASGNLFAVTLPTAPAAADALTRPLADGGWRRLAGHAG